MKTSRLAQAMTSHSLIIVRESGLMQGIEAADLRAPLRPESESIGVIGKDGKEYPIPTQEQVVELFAHNRELVGRKVPQGFDHLEITPMAMPTPLIIDRMKAAILKHAAEGKMYQTRRSPSGPLISVRV
jgi:hypothetical protein